MRIGSLGGIFLVATLAHFVGPQTPMAWGQASHLDQGWTEEERERFYFTAQGSQLIPFKWFLALEQVGNEQLFREDANIRRYGFLPASPSTLNPEGLPVGFVRDGVSRFHQAPESSERAFPNRRVDSPML